MNKKISMILSAIILALAVVVVGLLLFIKNQPPQQRGIAPITTIAALEADSSKWGVNFPNEYSTFLKTKENKTRTDFGGSLNYSKLEADPRLIKLFSGYSFSKAYSEDRGHQFALEDVQNTPRLNDKTPATCYSCKSSDNPKLWDQMGMAGYDNTTFSGMTPDINDPIGCANCHEAGSMRLVVTNPALEEALKAQGKDWRSFTRQEMRTMVCANCHVEYYFKQPGNYLTFPWEKGTTVEEIEAYYESISFKDWEHKESLAPLLKMQHPETELYSADSTHYLAGVSCVDCHMPYVRDGAAKFTSHNIKSPLLDPSPACGVCHTDVDYVVLRAKVIQKTVAATLSSTEDALVAAIDAISAAAAVPAADPEKLTEARNFHRKAQMRWDLVAAENSMGFHNPEEALRILASATDFARQAEIAALQAAGTGQVSK
jgi:nitrite reductase (cytochrome c-552)